MAVDVSSGRNDNIYNNLARQQKNIQTRTLQALMVRGMCVHKIATILRLSVDEIQLMIQKFEKCRYTSRSIGDHIRSYQDTLNQNPVINRNFQNTRPINAFKPTVDDYKLNNHKLPLQQELLADYFVDEVSSDNNTAQEYTAITKTIKVRKKRTSKANSSLLKKMQLEFNFSGYYGV